MTKIRSLKLLPMTFNKLKLTTKSMKIKKAIRENLLVPRVLSANPPHNLKIEIQISAVIMSKTIS